MGVEKSFIKAKVKELQVKEFLAKTLRNVGYSEAEIKRTPLCTRVTLHVLKPGKIVGKGGSKIKTLTNTLKKKFKLENPSIDVKEIEVPEIDPIIMAKKIAASLERGSHFKRAGHRVLSDILKKGALGVEISLSGKIPGKRARCWKFREGYIQACGEISDKYIKVGYATAFLKPGVVGIQVRILPPSEELLKKLGKTEFPKFTMVTEDQKEAV
jgi:small subunit ribosomal protein S3